MPTESRATSAVAALSVVMAVVGHALAGGAVPWWAVSPLLALAAVCWLLGEYLAGERLLMVFVLGCIQLFVHVSLDAVHPAMHDSMGMSLGIGGSLVMTAAHLSVLLAGVLAVGQAHRWVGRVVRLLARFLPRLPWLRPVLVHGPVAVGFSEPCVLRGARLGSSVSGRGPPGVRVVAAV
ncbi:hypothetical protein AB0E69_05955 [Kribbella sp. NPDC026611]|uniref:hypothetical protein n=1 Tax=Kribbella sp. NPDC026611 TaxID=3154911 RepID=UPI0033EFEC7E